MENNIIVNNTDNSIIINDNNGDYRVVKFKLDLDTNTVKVKELCDSHFRNNLNYNDMTLLILELTKLRDQLVPEEEDDCEDDDDDDELNITDLFLKDFSSDFSKVLDYTKDGINLFEPRSEGRVTIIATQTQQVLFPISEERKKMAIKQQDNVDALLDLKGKK